MGWVPTVGRLQRLSSAASREGDEVTGPGDPWAEICDAGALPPGGGTASALRPGRSPLPPPPQRVPSQCRLPAPPLSHTRCSAGASLGLPPPPPRPPKLALKRKGLECFCQRVAPRPGDLSQPYHIPSACPWAPGPPPRTTLWSQCSGTTGVECEGGDSLWNEGLTLWTLDSGRGPLPLACSFPSLTPSLRVYPQGVQPGDPPLPSSQSAPGKSSPLRQATPPHRPNGGTLGR